MAQTFIKIKNDRRQTWKKYKQTIRQSKISSRASLSINNIDDPMMIQNRSLITSMTTLLILLAN